MTNTIVRNTFFLSLALTSFHAFSEEAQYQELLNDLNNDGKDDVFYES